MERNILKDILLNTRERQMNIVKISNLRLL